MRGKAVHLITMRPVGSIASLCALSLVSCGLLSESSKEAGRKTSTASSIPSGIPRRAATAGELVTIPGGSFLAGSRPGSAGRKPKLEPEIRELELGPYQIDRLPFPNDPAKPPLVNVAREEAMQHCAERAARLCTELEWERACKGPASDPYATGAAWSPRCTHSPTNCASGFDVLAMGALREWTASAIGSVDSPVSGAAAVRGAPADAPAGDHGCARRAAVPASQRAPDLGFRCCKGAPNGAAVEEPKLGNAFEKARLESSQLEKLLARSPETRGIAHDIVFFHERDAAETVIARGPGDRKGFSFTSAPLIWNPVAGARYMVVTARSGKSTSFVAAFHVIGDSEYELAGSFIMEDEPGPVALAYDASIRPRTHFSTCWGCPGETGKIIYRDPDRVAIVQP